MRHVLSHGDAIMAFPNAAKVTMENKEHESRSLKLVGGDTDEKRGAARKYCAELVASYRRFCSGAEKPLQPGVLVQWKPNMKNRKTPEYGAPMIVIELLSPPIIDSTFDSGSVYFRERLDIILGFLDEDGEFSLLYYDSRRFQPYTGIGAE